jgi:hypothetical protein
MKLAAHIPQLVADMKVIIENDHNTATIYGMHMVTDDLFRGQMMGVLAMRDLDDAGLVSEAGYTGPRFLAQDTTLYAWMESDDFTRQDIQEMLQAVHDELCQHFEAALETPEGTAKMLKALAEIASKSHAH